MRLEERAVAAGQQEQTGKVQVGVCVSVEISIKVAHVTQPCQQG
jgi:hypothetical protein